MSLVSFQIAGTSYNVAIPVPSPAVAGISDKLSTEGAVPLAIAGTSNQLTISNTADDVVANNDAVDDGFIGEEDRFVLIGYENPWAGKNFKLSIQ